MPYEPLPRCSLGFWPTPLAPLPRLSARLGGPRLFMKRDDQTGLGLGGNKTRKLEFLVGEALAQGCDTLVTGGAAQSNHCRQTAAAAAACGLACHLVLGGEAPAIPEGNLLLDELFGAVIHWTGEFRKGEKIPEIAASLRSAGRKPYVVPYGGSNTTGAVGFVEAVRELTEQLAQLVEAVGGDEAAGAKDRGQTIDDRRPRTDDRRQPAVLGPRSSVLRNRPAFTHIVFASSSGGTHAGLMVGKRLFGLEGELVGIGIDKGPSPQRRCASGGDVPFEEYIVQLANATAERLGVQDRFSAAELILRQEYLGDGYGVVGELERRAIRMVAQTEGILLDPVYTGRAMGGLIDLIERGELSRGHSVLFWHTGGTPALFPYARDLISL